MKGLTLHLAEECIKGDVTSSDALCSSNSPFGILLSVNGRVIKKNNNCHSLA